MKKFIYTLLIFVTITSGLAIGLDFVITKGLHYYTSYETEVWNDLRNPDIQPNVIILGSCQAMYDYNPHIFDSVLRCDSYVFAMSNLTFPYHNFMWKMYKKYNANHLPKLIILSLDYGDLSKRNLLENEENKQFLPLTYEHEARQLMRRGGYSQHEILLPLYRYYGNHMMIKHGIISFFTHTGGKMDHNKGHIKLNSEYNSHSEWFEQPTSVEINNEIIEMLDSFVADCTKRNIKLLITIAPLGNDCANSITNIKDVYQVYYDISDKYDVPLFDYSECYLVDDIRNFESPFHLNGFAADEYTELVANEIKSRNIY